MTVAESRSPARHNAALATFGQHTVSMVTRALDADWGCFYLVDAALDTREFEPLGTPAELRAAYLEHGLAEVDPLHPRRLFSPRRQFATVVRPGRVVDRASALYWSVMRKFGAHRAGELLFWRDGRPIGGVSLIWRTEPPAASLDRAFGIRTYVEYNLGCALRGPRTSGNPASSPEAMGFSQREREVAALVCRGLANARIATELGISIATVKTHLLHIFSKAGVTSRTALLARLLPRH